MHISHKFHTHISQHKLRSSANSPIQIILMNIELLRVVLDAGHQRPKRPLQMGVLRLIEGRQGILQVGLGGLQGGQPVGGPGGGHADIIVGVGVGVEIEVGVKIGAVEVGGLQDAGVAGGELHGVAARGRIILISGEASGADRRNRRPSSSGGGHIVIAGIAHLRRQAAGRAVWQRGQTAPGRRDGGSLSRLARHLLVAAGAVLHLDAVHRRSAGGSRTLRFIHIDMADK